MGIKAFEFEHAALRLTSMPPFEVKCQCRTFEFECFKSQMSSQNELIILADEISINLQYMIYIVQRQNWPTTIEKICGNFVYFEICSAGMHAQKLSALTFYGLLGY